MDKLNEIRARLDAATPGPLEAEHRESLDWLSSSPYINTAGHEAGSKIHTGDPGNPIWGSCWPHRNARADAEFIANAPADIAWLLDQLAEAWEKGARTAFYSGRAGSDWPQGRTAFTDHIWANPYRDAH